MNMQFPPPRHRNWLAWGVFGAVGGALVAILLGRFATGQGIDSITVLLQAWVSASLLFLIYFGVLAAAGYFGLLIMVKTMLVGFVLACIALFYFAWRDNTGWGGLAAIAAFLQIAVLAPIAGAGVELGMFVWKRHKR